MNKCPECGSGVYQSKYRGRVYNVCKRCNREYRTLNQGDEFDAIDSIISNPTPSIY